METELLFWYTKRGLQYLKFSSSENFDRFVDAFERRNNLKEPTQVWNLFNGNKWYTNIKPMESAELHPVDSQSLYVCITPIPPEILAHALLLK